jgi:hypothetical protein
MRHLNFYSKDFVEVLQGGVSLSDDLFRWRLNGSIHDVINLPDQKERETCIKLAAAFHSLLIVSACTVPGETTNLYLTSEAS